MDLDKYYKKVVDEIGMLKKDINEIVVRLKSKSNDKSETTDKTEEGGVVKKAEKKISRRSLESMTKLRKSKTEAIEAAENKDLAFVRDQIDKIFS